MNHKIFLCCAPLLCALALVSHSQDASQLGFSALQAQANQLAEEGRLVEAMPLLKEFIDRVEGSEESSDVELDYPIFLVGTAYIQQYITSGQKSDLQQTLVWYDKLQKEYPNSTRIKDANLKRIDVLRALQEYDQATDLMKKILSGNFNFQLSFSERIKVLKDLSETLYQTDELQGGLPYFSQLLTESRDPEEQALAAAASFEALYESQRIDEAMRLVPSLARESKIRYQPRLNIALLEASDVLANQGRINDAAILLNLIKTTDLMIEYHESQIALKKAQVEQRTAFGTIDDSIETLKQEIKNLEANLEQLQSLPTLRNELLVRRARNYTQTERRYEAFWMFYDLMRENPNDQRIEFYMYAALSNARQIGKNGTVIEIGRDYREKFPDGDYYSDISVILATILGEEELIEEFSQLAVDFLSNRPIDPVAPSILIKWADQKFRQQEFAALIEQTDQWLAMHKTSTFEDGLYYWKGIGQLQLSEFNLAVMSFESVIQKFPNSDYAEDSLLRKGTAEFYAQAFEASRETFLEYTNNFPNGNSLDQANFFLGELENLAGDYEKAFEYFRLADSITQSQSLHDSVAFRIGSIYEAQENYSEMAANFEQYITTYGNQGRLTDAIYQLGRAFELMLKPDEMLRLYTSNIQQYARESNNAGVDTLIEAYGEKYYENQKTFISTVEFLDQVRDDLEYRKKIVTDRGFLFEQFYNNKNLESSLYNKLRNHPEFTKELMNDLSPIQDITQGYRDQLASFPNETPEESFKRLLAEARKENDRTYEAKMLMGLFRLGIVLDPTEPYDSTFISTATPRLMLYIADYERSRRMDLAIEAWNQILINYPTSDEAIVAYLRLADTSAEAGDLSSAVNYLDAIITLFPGSPKIPGVILRKGELLTSMGRSEEARKEYQYLLKVPEWRGLIHARALYQTGESLMAESKYPEAHGFFERTFLGYSHFTEWCQRAYLADAKALLAMNAKQDAIKTLSEAVEKFSQEEPTEVIRSIEKQLKELSQ